MTQRDCKLLYDGIETVGVIKEGMGYLAEFDNGRLMWFGKNTVTGVLEALPWSDNVMGQPCAGVTWKLDGNQAKRAMVSFIRNELHGKITDF